MGLASVFRSFLTAERPQSPRIKVTEQIDEQTFIRAMNQSRRLDDLQQSQAGDLGEPGELVNLEAERDKSTSKKKYESEGIEGAFIWLSNLAKLGDQLSMWGSRARDSELRSLWKQDSILAGAMTSMTQKMISLGYTVSGLRNQTRRTARLLQNSNDGRGWSDLIAKFVQEFLSQDNGAFLELGRADVSSNRVEGLWNIDSAYMYPRHDSKYPYWFGAPGKKLVKVPWTDVFQASSMPTPIDTYNSVGFCAVSRAARAAKLLIALHNYDADKLSNMPPQGIAAISGMTPQQVFDALKKYKLAMEQKTGSEKLIYPGVLWLASITGAIDVKMVPFSTLPDSFSRAEVIQIYVYTLALDFGVDAREFWPAAVAGATRADALVQAMKAKGKGPGELISVMERGLNSRVLPEGVNFGFDFQDDEEDEMKANIDFTRAKTVTEMYAHAAQMTGQPDGIIDKNEAREILSRWGIIPREMSQNPNELITDIGGFRGNGHKQIEVIINCRNGVMEETDMTRRFFWQKSSVSLPPREIIERTLEEDEQRQHV